MNILVYTTIYIVAQQFGYGVTDFTEDDFISNTKYWPTHNSSVVFMALYGGINFYTYLLVYIYSPAQKPVFGNYLSICQQNYQMPLLSCYTVLCFWLAESVVMKDNPAFSMVNDSEDEDELLDHKTKDKASSLLLGRPNDDSDWMNILSP